MPETNEPSYPLTVGPFNIPSYSNCKFSKESGSDAGTLTCDGGVSVMCKPDSTEKTICNGADEWEPWKECDIVGHA